MDVRQIQVMNEVDTLQGLTFFYNKILEMAESASEPAADELKEEAAKVKNARKANKPKKPKKPKEPKVEEFVAGEYALCSRINGYIDKDLLVTQHRYGESYYASNPYYNSYGVDKDYVLIAFTKTPDEDASIYTTVVTLPSSILDPKLLDALYTSAEYREEHKNEIKKDSPRA